MPTVPTASVVHCDIPNRFTRYVTGFLNRAGLLVQPNGRATLGVSNNLMLRDRFERICRGLAKAA
jgi:hypothetical protein